MPCSAILFPMKTLSFQYEFQGHASHLATGGAVEWYPEKKQWKATIIAQSQPEIRFEAWDYDSAVASLLCCAKWLGRDLQNDQAQAPKPAP